MGQIVTDDIYGSNKDIFPRNSVLTVILEDVGYLFHDSGGFVVKEVAQHSTHMQCIAAAKVPKVRIGLFAFYGYGLNGHFQHLRGK